MAAVWLAYQHGPHGFLLLVALKTILPKFSAEPGFREMLLDEARVASRIVHPNVAEIIDVGEINNLVYLVMEWLEGDSLLRVEPTVLRKSLALPAVALLRVLSDACAGPHEAHEFRDECVFVAMDLDRRRVVRRRGIQAATQEARERAKTSVCPTPR